MSNRRQNYTHRIKRQIFLLIFVWV